MAKDNSTNLFFYNASLAAAILFAILYGFMIIAHAGPAFTRSQEKHRYMIPCFVAAIISHTGFAIRCGSVTHTDIIGLYAASASLIVISPIFICASLYLLLAHLIRRCIAHPTDQTLLGLQPRWLGRAFITSDVFSFLTQGSGSGIAASNNWQGSSREIGTNVLLAGLSIQLATFTIFLVLLHKFCWRVRTINGGFEPITLKIVRGVWIASAFVEIRSIYRTIEFALGIYGYPFQHEWPLYVLEAAPILFALGVLFWNHPARLLQDGYQDRSLKVGLSTPAGQVGDGAIGLRSNL